jgi:preprotein translocase subunit YajC
MLISPAFAQDAGGSFGTMTQFLPLILIFAVFYFLLIRPQQQKQKQMKASLAALKRGDRVITGGGIVATVSKPPKGPEEREIELEIAKDIRITVLRDTISAVVPPPRPANDPKPAGTAPASPLAGGLGGLLKGMFGKKEG